MSGVLVDREALENLLAGWDEGLWGPGTQDAGVPDVITDLIDSLRAALALPAQAAADAAGVLMAEVWVHNNEYAELLSVTGCVHAHIWEDLKTDLTENPPELPEGAYIVPVDRDNTDPTGMASGAYTYYLDWDAAKRVELCTSCARPVPINEVVSVVMDESASVPMCPKCAAHDARLRALADALEVQG